MTAKPKHIVVGISGGVDSAVAAMMLIEQGYDVTGVFMKNWEEDDDAEYCAAAEDYREARAVCATLGIPLRAVNFAAEYWERVFAYFLDEYRRGRTPNPDVMCNKEIKFKAFLDYALALGAECIATGHYARRTTVANSHRLAVAADSAKDQTYFLYAIGQRELAHSLFPIGDLTKPEVRARAQAAGLPNHARKDSTGICFIGERKFSEFLSRYLPAQPGEIRTAANEAIGRHQGLMYYTLGQRQGLGIGGAGAAWYVVEKDVAANVLYVAQGDDAPELFKPALLAEAPHWIAGVAPALPLRCHAKTRYRQTAQTCTVSAHATGLLVSFDQPQRAPTPGQSVVFYADDVCLGGAIISGVPQTASASDSAIDAKMPRRSHN